MRRGGPPGINAVIRAGPNKVVVVRVRKHGDVLLREAGQLPVPIMNLLGRARDRPLVRLTLERDDCARAEVTVHGLLRVFDAKPARLYGLDRATEDGGFNFHIVSAMACTAAAVCAAATSISLAACHAKHADMCAS